MSPLNSTLARLRERRYIDTSFEDRETHPLIIRSLTKKKALDEYRESGGKTWVLDEIVKKMPYIILSPTELHVIIMKFDRHIKIYEALAEMSALGVRPLIYEELIQYGTTYPSHQKKNSLIALGSKYSMDGYQQTPLLERHDGKRVLFVVRSHHTFRTGSRFLVVPK